MIGNSISNGYASIRASVADNEAATTQDCSNGSDELSNYRSAMEIHYPILDFGGLSYWKTTAPKENSLSKSRFRVLFVLGGPGAGKGTQSELMAQHYPVVHLSAGQLLRDASTDPECEHRELIKEALVSGKIVPVEISLSLLEVAMDKASKDAGDSILFLVDGFPRNEDNLAGWCRCMDGVASIWAVIFYNCSLDVLESRILERAKNSGRTDDNLESLHRRFATFERDTMPIIRKLETLAKNSHWSVKDVAADSSLDDVWCATQQCLNGLIQHDVLSANADLLGDQAEDIFDAQVEFISGKTADVSYTRIVDDREMREKRTWNFQQSYGWTNTDVAITPIS